MAREGVICLKNPYAFRFSHKLSEWGYKILNANGSWINSECHRIGFVSPKPIGEKPIDHKYFLGRIKSSQDDQDLIAIGCAEMAKLLQRAIYDLRNFYAEKKPLRVKKISKLKRPLSRSEQTIRGHFRHKAMDRVRESITQQKDFDTAIKLIREHCIKYPDLSFTADYLKQVRAYLFGGKSSRAKNSRQNFVFTLCLIFHLLDRHPGKNKKMLIDLLGNDQDGILGSSDYEYKMNSEWTIDRKNKRIAAALEYEYAHPPTLEDRIDCVQELIRKGFPFQKPPFVFVPSQKSQR